MRYKIYFGDSPLFLTDQLDAEMQEIMHHDDGVFMDELSNAAVKSMIHEMKDPRRHAGVFYHEQLDQLQKAFWKHFTIIKAGGGLVKNDQGKLLMIFRRGKWDLPKGKLDPGETLEQCALREVEEETGISQLEILSQAGITFHVYDEYGKHILKESYWYHMRAKGDQTPVAQAEEQITDITWASEDEVESNLRNSFPLIRDLLANGG